MFSSDKTLKYKHRCAVKIKIICRKVVELKQNSKIYTAGRICPLLVVRDIRSSLKRICFFFLSPGGPCINGLPSAAQITCHEAYFSPFNVRAPVNHGPKTCCLFYLHVFISLFTIKNPFYFFGHENK